LPPFFYGYETWLVTYREEHRLSAFENNAEEYWLHLPQDRSKCWTLWTQWWTFSLGDM